MVVSSDFTMHELSSQLCPVLTIFWPVLSALEPVLFKTVLPLAVHKDHFAPANPSTNCDQSNAEIQQQFSAILTKFSFP
jgi:hypothetical protein